MTKQPVILGQLPSTDGILGLSYSFVSTLRAYDNYISMRFKGDESKTGISLSFKEKTLTFHNFNTEAPS